MLSIKDYLSLITIRKYLIERTDEEIRENNGYSSNPVMELEKMVKDLDRIILRLEKEEE